MKVGIASGVAELLLAEASAAHPHECCGLLLGADAGCIDAGLPAANVAARPETGFEIDPALLLRAHREARGAGRRILGHYHSHPNGSPEPSPRDAARALDDGQLWLIIAAGTITAWRAQPAADALHGRFRPVALEPR